MSDELDILIKNAFIIDGTGVPAYNGMVAIKGERIVDVGKVNDDPKWYAKTVIDSKGLTVTPGFIDVHNHVDLSILYYPKAESFIRQGITSFVGGQCGDSPGPYGDLIGEPWFLMDLYEDVRPRMFRNDWQIPKDLINARHKEIYGWEIDWGTMGQFFKRVKETGLTPNYVPLVGHGDIRTLVMGTDYKRKATKKEIREMKKHVEQAMQDGCVGISVGRTYIPGNYATFEEILACAKVTAKYRGIYTSHCLRTAGPQEEGKEQPPNPIAGVLEAIDVGRKAKMSVQISHLGNQFIVQPPKNRIMDEASVLATLKTIDEARKEGINVNFDIIPHHNTGGIFTSPWLAGMLNPWLKMAGSPKHLAEILKMKDLREDIKEKIDAGKLFMLDPKRFPDWAKGAIIKVCKDERFVDKSIAEIADELCEEPVDALMDVLMADPEAKYAMQRNEEDWIKLEYYKNTEMMIGCDTFAVDEKTVNRHPPWFLPNQNAFGGMVRYLRRTVREAKILTLEEAIRKITCLPARKHLIKDRGILKAGAYADIVVMDPTTISDKGNQLDPRQYPEGIKYVIVNGTIVLKNNKHTCAMPGKILYRE
jgi:N-acyl-D-amino-acid deacylase